MQDNAAVSRHLNTRQSATGIIERRHAIDPGVHVSTEELGKTKCRRKRIEIGFPIRNGIAIDGDSSVFEHLQIVHEDFESCNKFGLINGQLRRIVQDAPAGGTRRLILPRFAVLPTIPRQRNHLHFRLMEFRGYFMTGRITVIIPCKNERMNIRHCIDSVREFADEILVADSGSSDGTLEIVNSMGGCRIIEREYVHSGDFKNWAIPQASHEWVLILDADERVSPELAQEITASIERSDCDGFWVFRNNYLLGHPVRRGGWGHDSLLRLFRRDHGRYRGDTDHAEVHVDTDRVGTLRHRLEHFTSWTYEQCLRKMERYTCWQATVWHRQGRKPSLLKLFCNAPLRFLRSYILHLGCLDGVIGFQVAMLSGYYSYLKQVRLWELYHAIPQPDPEAEHTVVRTGDPSARAA